MRKWYLLILCCVCAFPSWGQLQRKYDYGVMPTENITSLEINPVLTV